MPAYVNPQFANLRNNDPRFGLAQQLIRAGTDTSPAQSGSGLEALARALQGVGGAYYAKTLNDEYAQRGQDAATTRAMAYNQMAGKDAGTQSYADGTTVNWDKQDPNMAAGLQTLASNPDTSADAQEIQLKQIEAAQEAKAQENRLRLADELAKPQREAEQQYRKDTLGLQRDQLDFDREKANMPSYQSDGLGGVFNTRTGIFGSPLPTQTTSGAPGLTGADIAAGGTSSVPSSGNRKIDYEVNLEAQKDKLKQNQTTQQNVKGAQEFLSKSGDLRRLLQQTNADGSFKYDKNGNPVVRPEAEGIFGRVAGGGTGQMTDTVGSYLPVVGNHFNNNLELHDQVQNQLSNLELAVASMKLKGQGSITDAERQLAKNTLPQFTNANAQTALRNLDQTEMEAKRLVGNSSSDYKNMTDEQLLKSLGLK